MVFRSAFLDTGDNWQVGASGGRTYAGRPRIVGQSTRCFPLLLRGLPVRLGSLTNTQGTLIRSLLYLLRRTHARMLVIAFQLTATEVTGEQYPQYQAVDVVRKNLHAFTGVRGGILGVASAISHASAMVPSRFQMYIAEINTWCFSIQPFP